MWGSLHRSIGLSWSWNNFLIFFHVINSAINFCHITGKGNESSINCQRQNTFPSNLFYIFDTPSPGTFLLDDDTTLLCLLQHSDPPSFLLICFILQAFSSSVKHINVNSLLYLPLLFYLFINLLNHIFTEHLWKFNSGCSSCTILYVGNSGISIFSWNYISGLQKDIYSSYLGIFALYSTSTKHLFPNLMQGSESGVLKQMQSMPTRNLLEMQILRSNPRPMN